MKCSFCGRSFPVSLCEDVLEGVMLCKDCLRAAAKHGVTMTYSDPCRCSYHCSCPPLNSTAYKILR